MTRRTLLATTTAAALAQQPKPRPTLCLFSKHAAQLNYKDLAKYCKESGFEGVDLTVRPGGHVLPAKVAEDLPVAVETLRAAGLEVPMITTGLTSARAPEAAATLRAAGALKIPFWKVGYFRYDTTKLDAGDNERKLAEVQAALTEFSALSRLYNIVAGFHNHSGNYVGAPVWDTAEMFKSLDPKTIGYYFDPAHATAEGGAWTWNASLAIAVKRLRMVAVKDFYWEKTKGKWAMKWCPLGEGMVDWPKVLQVMAKSGFTGPLTLHVEYNTPDELKANAQDFATMKKLVDAAYA
jgi:L-ribulose-5-phosphate 3-epimerase